ncbi:hypothetical protein D3C77_314540 [compost metagenome]
MGGDLLVARTPITAFIQKAIQRFMQTLRATVGVVPPVGRPDAQDAPAEAPQNLLAHLVSVTRGRCAMIGSAVAFDTGQVGAREIGVTDSKVDPEARHADLRNHLPTSFFQLRGDGLLERRVKPAHRPGVQGRQGDAASLSVVEEGLEVVHGQRLGARRVDLIRGEA